MTDAYCVDCGSWLPPNQGSRTCSMCYGDPGHGRDGYYQAWLEREAEADAHAKAQEESYWREQEAEYARSLEEEAHGR